MEKGEDANRISISAWILKTYYQEILPNDYALWFKDRAGAWRQVAQGYTLEVQVARLRLPRTRVLRFSIRPHPGFDMKTEFDEKKVFDF